MVMCTGSAQSRKKVTSAAAHAARTAATHNRCTTSNMYILCLLRSILKKNKLKETNIEDFVFEEAPEEEVDEVFTIVEDQPAFPGGNAAFYKFVGSNMTYPSQARRMGIEGRVFVQFVVDKDGSVTEVKAVKGIGAGCDQEAERVLKTSPKWTPGKQRGRSVKVRMVLPIIFKLNN